MKDGRSEAERGGLGLILQSLPSPPPLPSPPLPSPPVDPSGPDTPSTLPAGVRQHAPSSALGTKSARSCSPPPLLPLSSPGARDRACRRGARTSRCGDHLTRDALDTGTKKKKYTFCHLENAVVNKYRLVGEPNRTCTSSRAGLH